MKNRNEETEKEANTCYVHLPEMVGNSNQIDIEGLSKSSTTVKMLMLKLLLEITRK